jgi:hypothetical protein
LKLDTTLAGFEDGGRGDKPTDNRGLWMLRVAFAESQLGNSSSVL